MIIRTLAFAALVGIITTGAASAQNWTSYQYGNQRNYTGTDQNGGTWTGRSYQYGNQTNSEFYGPNGQTTTCRTYPMGNQIHTDCQ